MKDRVPILWFVACVIVLVLWVVVTEPLNRASINLIPLLSGGLVGLALIGLGAPLVRVFGDLLTPFDQALCSLVIGAGLTGLFVFLPGLAGVVSQPLYALWLVAGLILFLVAAWKWKPPPDLDLGWRAPLGVAALVIIIIHLIQLVPYTMVPVCSTDALEYHLMIPKIHVLEGAISHIPSLVESNYPCLAQYVYMPVLALAGGIACKSLNLWMGFAALVAIGRLSRRVWPRTNALLAPALFLSMPVTNTAWGVAWNDSFFVLAVLLGLGQLADAAADRERALPRLILAGILIGIAAWIKYTIVMILLALAPVFLVQLLRRRWTIAQVGAFAVPVFVISLNVFVKNWVFTGNPVYPFLHSVFSSPYWTDAADAYFHNGLRNWEITNWSPWTYLSFPFHITILPRLIDTHTGIMPLVLIPFLFARNPRREFQLLRLFVVFNTVAWLILHTENRSLFSMFAVIFVLAAGGLTDLVARGAWFKRGVLVVMVASGLANFAVSAVNTLYMTEPLRYFFGLESRETFLLREAESQHVISWLNRHDEVQAVLLVGLKRPYHLQRSAYFSAFADPPIAEVMTRGADGVEDIYERLLQYGITHVAINMREYEEDHALGLYSWSDQKRRSFEAFLDRHGTPVFSHGDEIIYMIR